MKSRSWGLIAAVALIAGAVLLGISVIWRAGPEPSETAIATTSDQVAEAEVTPSPSPLPVPTPPPPLTYTVQAGDSLSAIAHAHDVPLDRLITANNIVNPDLLQVGQTLFIPRGETLDPAAVASEEDPAEGSSAADLLDLEVPTLTPSDEARVTISEVIGVGSLTAETIVLESDEGTVSLEGWTLSTAASDTFVFPALTLFAQSAVRVHSSAGENTPRDLYWGRAESAWQPGELLTLRNAEGTILDTHIISGP